MLLLLCASCTRSLEFGDDLLGEEFINVQTIDTLTIKAKTIINDSSRVFSTTAIPLRYLIGKVEDPTFGTYESEINLQFGVLDSLSDVERFPTSTLDSIVFRFSVDSQGFYGNGILGMGLEFRELGEQLAFDDHDASEMPSTTGDLIGEIGTFIPDSKSFIRVQEVAGQATDSTIFREDSLGLRMSVRLDDALGQKWLDADPSVFDSDESFRNFFPGLKITPSETSQAMMGVSAFNSGIIQLYYKDVDTAGVERSYFYRVQVIQRCFFSGLDAYDPSCVIFSNYEHDYSGSPVENFFDDYTMGDSLLFLQGMIGTSIEMDFPTLPNLGSILLNKAQLKLYVDYSGVDEDLFEAINQLVVSYEDENGDLIPIEDIVSLSSFSGALEEDPDTGDIFYEINMTAHFQEIVDGKKPTKIFILPSQRPIIPNRTVLFGAGNSTAPAKLSITFSEN